MANTPVKTDFFNRCAIGQFSFIDSASGAIETGGFVLCIQMNADTDQHGSKRKMIPATYFKVLETGIV